MIESDVKEAAHFKSDGNVYVDIKPTFYIFVLFFLTFSTLVMAKSIDLGWKWSDYLLAFTVLVPFAGTMGYIFFRDGLFCFAADQDGWYFRNKGQMTMLRVPWSDCHQLSTQSQAGGDGTAIVFNIARSAVTTMLKPKNAHVSEEDDIISIEFSGLISSQSKIIRRLDALQRDALTRRQQDT